jgi:hypothetical protein
MTLGEIGENDLEMTKDAIKNANKYSFGNNQQKAVLFVRHCIDTTLKRCGIKVSPPKNSFARKLYEKKLDWEMKQAGVVIEKRNKYKGADEWRNGLYITKDGVLVSFISDVMHVTKGKFKKSKMRVVRKSFGYIVITNARTDNISRIYTPTHAEKVTALKPPPEMKKVR